MRLLRLPLLLCLLAPGILRAQSNLVLIVGPECYYPNASIRTVLGTEATDVNVIGTPSALTFAGKLINVIFAGPNGADLTVGQYSNTIVMPFQSARALMWKDSPATTARTRPAISR